VVGLKKLGIRERKVALISPETILLILDSPTTCQMSSPIRSKRARNSSIIQPFGLGILPLEKELIKDLSSSIVTRKLSCSTSSSEKNLGKC